MSHHITSLYSDAVSVYYAIIIKIIDRVIQKAVKYTLVNARIGGSFMNPILKKLGLTNQNPVLVVITRAQVNVNLEKLQKETSTYAPHS